ncbi:hypothetical protein BABINDRAFT_165065 [Babjeviella inositovora NRRL Y-12698]|uniref:Vesicular-fusion protein SEC18 n=1 Tax=Babjeviella inositovora NRRL Y-12698 TaxID=984486 RepID=A0A1E3QV30_9ASCO|nr:uncharacterized protein BABINDRAFT_165065 [Babjeviella inositovora NRRL Y-12698]ODQ81519.1 hypothetical protein BABINDRAFT_165065 [Babjeviella inositovora NRRL Y-12698]
MERFGFNRVSGSDRALEHKAPARSHGIDFQVANAPDNAFSLSNCIAVSSQDFQDGQYILINNLYVYTARTVPNFPVGSIGANANQRLFVGLSYGAPCQVSLFDLRSVSRKQTYLGSLTVAIDFVKRAKAVATMFDTEELAKEFVTRFENQILQPGQPIFMEHKGNMFTIKVQSVQLVDISEVIPSEPVSKTVTSKGILVKQSAINFVKGPDGLVNLKNSGASGSRADAIIAPDFKFEDMGIGGLDVEFTAIFRRAFASRILSPELIDKMGLKHVKGLLLYGPPGTGKTLIARRIGAMLNVKEPKIVNGPEILSKYVGSSEENVRNLFVDAEAEYKSKGESSSLHIIIFDELDSVFKQRGSRGDGTGVGDNVVNQLLSKMDGVDQLNNILIIGMTNRLDLIDNALLRPGRFEVQLEISLPDEKGRVEIFKIQTKKMADNGMLAKDVDFHELAAMTKNFTGAEIEGLVKSASSFAINKHLKVGSMAALNDDVKNLKLTRKDFLGALSEVKAAFGVSDQDLNQCMPFGIIGFSPYINEIMKMGKALTQQVKTTETEKLVSVLLHGPPGSGKTALAAALALNTEFPFIKMLSPEAMVGMSEPARIQYIDNAFRDVYKSPLSVLVVDNIERIINYVPIGPRFSNDILQLLLVNLTRKPPHDRRLLIISTTSDYRLLEQMNALPCFTKEIAVPNLSDLSEFYNVMDESNFLNDAEREKIINTLQHDNPQGRFNLSVKKALGHLDTVKYHEDSVNEIIRLMSEAIL